MPERQADATVEVVRDAMQNLVTKEYFDQRFTKLEAKIDTSIANLGRSQAMGFVYMSGFTVAVAALLFTALQIFGPGAAPVNFP